MRSWSATRRFGPCCRWIWSVSTRPYAEHCSSGKKRVPPPEPPTRDLLALLRPSAAPDPVEPADVRKKRRVIVAATGVVGALLLGVASAQPRNSSAFSVLAVLLAATWVIGSVLSGPLHLGRVAARRSLLVPVILGAGAFGVFAVGALLVRHIPPLHSAV